MTCLSRIYNSRNYYRLLNYRLLLDLFLIYNSRNYYRLLNLTQHDSMFDIYNSRNYYRLLNTQRCDKRERSTTVEITIGYLTLQDSTHHSNLQQ